MRRHGLTVDNLRAVDLVTADGERLRVDAEREPELFWGLRGGGGNFGIATAFEYDLHPVGPIVLGGPIFWPLEQAPEVLRFLREFAPGAPDELGIAIVAHARAADAVPAAGALRHAGARAAAWSGPATSPRARGRSRRCGRSARRSATWSARSPTAPCSPCSTAAPRPATTAYWQSHRLPDLSDAVIDVIVAPRRIGHLAAVAAQRLGDRRRGEPGRPGRDRRRRARGRLRAPADRRLAARRPGRRAAPRLGARRAGKRCARTAPAASTRPSCPTRASPASGPRTAIASTGSPPSRTATTRPTSSASTPTSHQHRRNPMKILVTGATGNVGAHVVRALGERGDAGPRVRPRPASRPRACSARTSSWPSATSPTATRSSAPWPASTGSSWPAATCPGQVEYECAVIDAAAAAGVRRVVKLSGPRRRGRLAADLRALARRDRAAPARVRACRRCCCARGPT